MTIEPDLETLIAEFSRLTNAGNVKHSNGVMVKIIRLLMAEIAALHNSNMTAPDKPPAEESFDLDAEAHQKAADVEADMESENTAQEQVAETGTPKRSRLSPKR